MNLLAELERITDSLLLDWSPLVSAGVGEKRVPTARPTRVLRATFRKITPQGEEEVRKYFKSHEDNSSAHFETLGYWDWVSLRHKSSFDTLMTADLPLPKARSWKLIYGSVLATNLLPREGAEIDQVLKESFAANSHPPGILAHYKLNPFLLYTGRSDLLVHTAQFIALLLAAPTSPFWNSDEIATTWTELSSGGRALDPEVVDNARNLLARIRAYLQDSGLRFILLRNFDSSDLSLYAFGSNLDCLSQIAFFVRELPVVYPRLLSRLKAKLSGSTPPALGPTLDRAEAKKNERLFLRFLQQTLPHMAPDSKRHPREYLPEAPIFADYADVLTLAPGQSGDSHDVLFVHRFNVKAGRAHWIANELCEDDRRLSLASGVINYARTTARLEPTPLESHAEFLFSRETVGLFPVRTELLYKRLERLSRGSMFRTLELYLENLSRNFSVPTIQDRLEELSVPLGVRSAVLNILNHYLAERTDATMFDSFVDFLDVWPALDHFLRDELLCVQQERLRRAAHAQPSDLVLDNPKERISALCGFADDVGAALNAQVHSSHRMFEFSDLEHASRGGAQKFVQAWAEIVKLALAVPRGIPSDDVPAVIARVTTGGGVHVKAGIVLTLEIDWESIAAPEQCLVALHELGHCVIQLDLFSPLRELLEDDAENPVWENALFAAGKLKEWYRGPSGVVALLEDIFCDLFMLEELSWFSRAAAPAGEKECQRPFTELYDAYYWSSVWSQLEQGRENMTSEYVSSLFVRWSIARRLHGVLTKTRSAENSNDPLWRYYSDFVAAMTEAEAVSSGVRASRRTDRSGAPSWDQVHVLREGWARQVRDIARKLAASLDNTGQGEPRVDPLFLWDNEGVSRDFELFRSHLPDGTSPFSQERFQDDAEVAHWLLLSWHCAAPIEDSTEEEGLWIQPIRLFCRMTLYYLRWCFDRDLQDFDRGTSNGSSEVERLREGGALVRSLIELLPYVVQRFRREGGRRAPSESERLTWQREILWQISELRLWRICDRLCETSLDGETTRRSKGP